MRRLLVQALAANVIPNPWDGPILGCGEMIHTPQDGLRRCRASAVTPLGDSANRVQMRDAFRCVAGWGDGQSNATSPLDLEQCRKKVRALCSPPHCPAKLVMAIEIPGKWQLRSGEEMRPQ